MFLCDVCSQTDTSTLNICRKITIRGAWHGGGGGIALATALHLVSLCSCDPADGLAVPSRTVPRAVIHVGDPAVRLLFVQYDRWTTHGKVSNTTATRRNSTQGFSGKTPKLHLIRTWNCLWNTWYSTNDWWLSTELDCCTEERERDVLMQFLACSGAAKLSFFFLVVLFLSFFLASFFSQSVHVFVLTICRWSDNMKRTKVVILFANLWQIAGSLLYWLGYGPWCLVAGRFVAGASFVYRKCIQLQSVWLRRCGKFNYLSPHRPIKKSLEWAFCVDSHTNACCESCSLWKQCHALQFDSVAGIGTGMGPAILADIARVTSTEERTATLSTFSAVRQLGLLIGKIMGCWHLNIHGKHCIWIDRAIVIWKIYFGHHTLPAQHNMFNHARPTTVVPCSIFQKIK